MTKKSIYQDMAERTDGGVYIAVVGPVRTGKSTFIRRMMEQSVIPSMENSYKRDRAKDELPQSASGKTIMTAEPKFVPEEPVEISPDGCTTFSVRLIDSVGYMIPGAVGAEEDGVPRMVTTPWSEEPIPMTEAAELGTRRVMEEHCSIGIVVTTDGSITEIPREDYIAAEDRSIRDMQKTGKPFLVLVNSMDPGGKAAVSLQQEIEDTYGVGCMTVDCMALTESDISRLMTELLMSFPVAEFRFRFPRWMERLESEHPVKKELYQKIRTETDKAVWMRDAEYCLSELEHLPFVTGCQMPRYELGKGAVYCAVDFPDTMFYKILSEKSGFEVLDDGDLMALLQSLSEMKREYDQVSEALREVQSTGYGIVMPRPEQMKLEQPEIVRKGSSYGVRLKATAPSIHMMRADLQAEISPIVGDEKQSQDLLRYLVGENTEDTEQLWSSNIFGKSVFELVNENLAAKMHRMPDGTRLKLKDTLTRMVNEGCTGLICLMF